MKDHFLKFYVAKFLRDTQQLSVSEVGVYIRLLAEAWQAGGFLPANKSALARLVGSSKQHFGRIAETVLQPPYFVEVDGYICQKRLLIELDELSLISLPKTPDAMLLENAKGKLEMAKSSLPNVTLHPYHGTAKSMTYGSLARARQDTKILDNQNTTVGDNTPRARGKASAEPIDRDWKPSPQLEQRLTLKGQSYAPEIENFVLYQMDKGNTSANWDAAFERWMRNKPRFDNGAGKSNGSSTLIDRIRIEKRNMDRRH